jgi:2-dehydro-3-deoxyphosphooctonate aldolase (KDO 8-P synthase)
MNTVKKVKIDKLAIANNLPLVVIAGPCLLESRELALHVAEKMVEITSELGMPYIFKASFDKANRTSINSARGGDIKESMAIFAEIKEKFGCPILTDVHGPEQCEQLAEVVDVLQIPAFLCRQTDLLVAAARTGLVVNVKKGQFLAPWNMAMVAEKISSADNHNIMFTERGVSFGYNTLVNDMRSLPIMADTGYPIVFDATHSVQQPGALGEQSGGERRFIRPLARAAVAVGVAAVFLETHPNPATAPSDSTCMLELSQMKQLLIELKSIDQLAKQFNQELAL